MQKKLSNWRATPLLSEETGQSQVSYEIKKYVRLFKASQRPKMPPPNNQALEIQVLYIYFSNPFLSFIFLTDYVTFFTKKLLQKSKRLVAIKKLRQMKDFAHFVHKYQKMKFISCSIVLRIAYNGRLTSTLLQMHYIISRFYLITKNWSYSSVTWTTMFALLSLSQQKLGSSLQLNRKDTSNSVQFLQFKIIGVRHIV